MSGSKNWYNYIMKCYAAERKMVRENCNWTTINLRKKDGKISFSAFLPSTFEMESLNSYVAYWIIAFKRHRNISSYKNSLYIKKEEKEKKLKIYKSFVSKYEGNPGWGSSQPFIVDIHVSCFL